MGEHDGLSILKRLLGDIRVEDISASDWTEITAAQAAANRPKEIVRIALRQESVARRVVQLLYRCCLSRDPDPRSWTIVTQQIMSSHPTQDVAHALLASDVTSQSVRRLRASSAKGHL